ncbi:MAG: DUF6088 family protein, partial [Paludibacter sp.]|nr:DUF6088 family protein [Paludibacter sp.]
EEKTADPHFNTFSCPNPREALRNHKRDFSSPPITNIKKQLFFIVSSQIFTIFGTKFKDMERPVIESKVAEALKGLPKGSILFVDDFLDFGNPESIKKSLLRLKEKGLLVSLAHGIYLYPKTDADLGVLYSSVEEIAIAIARRDKARIIPTGIQALNKLGLSTQIPLKAVYLTDGTARTIKIGKRTITFKNTSPKNLLVKGEISGLVIQALKSISQDKIEDTVIIKLTNILKKEKIENILHDAKLSPAWINKILMSSIN